MTAKHQYAATTSVSVGKSRAEIEDLLRRHGATEFASGWTPTHDTLQFKLRDMVVRFVLPRPDPKDKRFTPRRAAHLEDPDGEADAGSDRPG